MSTPSPLAVFRCDASTAIGMGHVKRCLSLAQALRLLGARSHFVTRQTDIAVGALISSAGFGCSTLPAIAVTSAHPDFHDETTHAQWLGTTQAQDAEDTVAALNREDLPKPCWLVADHYGLAANWHGQIRAALGCRVAAIDDLADRPLDVDLLIDHNLHADHQRKYASCIQAQTRVLGGPRYALLAPSYAQLRPARIKEFVGSIGIFMGGVDSADLGSLALRACREVAGFQGSIEIAATSASPHLTSLRALVDSSPDTRLSIDQPDLTEFFTRHDLQIGAGGGATWERCCAGAPMLLLKAAENQVTVLQELSAQGAARCLNDSGVATVASVGQAVAELLRDGSARKSLAERARALVDGLGAQRVATAMTLDHLVLRPAKADDAALSFGWRNDHSSRQHSRDAAEINPDHHRQWWKDSLVNPNRQIFFGCLGSRDVGVLRLDFSGAEAEVSIYLDPAMTGLGLGPRILLAAQRWALEHTTLERLVATILPSNTASMRAFSSAGFVRQEKGWVWTVSASQTSGQPAFPGA